MEITSLTPQTLTTQSTLPSNQSTPTSTADASRTTPVAEANPTEQDKSAPGLSSTSEQTRKPGSTNNEAGPENPILKQLLELIENLKEQIQQVQAQLAQAQARAKADISAQPLVDALNSTLATLQGSLSTAYANYLEAMKQQAESGGNSAAQLVNTTA